MCDVFLAKFRHTITVTMLYITLNNYSDWTLLIILEDAFSLSLIF